MRLNGKIKFVSKGLDEARQEYGNLQVGKRIIAYDVLASDAEEIISRLKKI